MKPIVTEKAVMMIESQNILTFIVDKRKSKEEIKKDVEEVFDVKVDEIRTNNRAKGKYAYVKLNSKNPAIDVATKLGLM